MWTPPPSVPGFAGRDLGSVCKTDKVNRLASATSAVPASRTRTPVAIGGSGRPTRSAEAEARDVPVLISVGYAACHWCHVMAHEC